MSSPLTVSDIFKIVDTLCRKKIEVDYFTYVSTCVQILGLESVDFKKIMCPIFNKYTNTVVRYIVLADVYDLNDMNKNMQKINSLLVVHAALVLVIPPRTLKSRNYSVNVDGLFVWKFFQPLFDTIKLSSISQTNRTLNSVKRKRGELSEDETSCVTVVRFTPNLLESDSLFPVDAHSIFTDTKMFHIQARHTYLGIVCNFWRSSIREKHHHYNTIE